MICRKCGKEFEDEKFCMHCGAPADASAADTHTEDGDEELVTEDVKRARDRVKSFEEGSIELKEKKSIKRKVYCPKNPMLASFLALLAFGGLLGIIDVILWNTASDPLGYVTAVLFMLIALAIIALGVIFYLIPAFRLDRLFKGKNVVLEYKLRREEIEEQAQRARKKNRLIYIGGAVVSALFTVFYAYRLTSTEPYALLWISFWVSLVLCAAFITLFIIMPRVNYEMMLENGERVIISSSSVYYGGTYYHWNKIEPKLTYGNYNPKKESLVLTYTRLKKDGSAKKKRVELFAPERELKGITKMLGVFELNVKEYRLQEEKNKIITGQGAGETGN